MIFRHPHGRALRSPGPQATAAPAESPSRRSSGRRRTARPGPPAAVDGAGAPGQEAAGRRRPASACAWQPAALRRSPPRASRSPGCRAASHGAASSANNSPKCARETPDRAGWEQAARAEVSFTTRLTRMALATADQISRNVAARGNRFTWAQPEPPATPGADQPPHSSSTPGHARSVPAGWSRTRPRGTRRTRHAAPRLRRPPRCRQPRSAAPESTSPRVFAVHRDEVLVANDALRADRPLDHDVLRDQVGDT